MIERLVIGGSRRVGRPRTLEASEFRVERMVSKGHLEALELRDLTSKAAMVKGAQKAVENMKTVLGPKIMGQDSRDQGKLGRLLI